MSVNNFKHRIFGRLGRIGIPLLLLLLFSWGVPQTAEAGYRGRFVGHRWPPQFLREPLWLLRPESRWGISQGHPRRRQSM